jgi:hypothetical protein
LIDRLAAELNRAGGSVHVGGYGGWIRLMLSASSRNSSFNIKYFHGSGGNDSPVTRGVIQTARQAVFEPDADCIWNGHNHNEYVLSIPRERLSGKGKIYRDSLWCIRTPGYNDEFGLGRGGWAVEKGLAPKSLGCVWLKLYYDGLKIGITAEQDVR